MTTLSDAVKYINAALAEGWMDAINNADGARLKELWLSNLHGIVGLEEPKPLTGGEAVFKMRDEFLQLAKCHLELHNYKAAQASIQMVQALEKFESEVNITGIVWPAEVECGEFNNWLKGNEDTRVNE